MEYIIKAIDEAPPRKWEGEHGTVWYVNVGLEGHEKPVSMGKKDPSTLKVGGKVYGSIVPTDFPTDKWKGEAPQGNIPPNRQAGLSLKEDNKFLKDISDTPKDLFKACLPYSDFNSLLRGEIYYTEYMEFIQLASGDLMTMMETVRNGEPEKKFEFKKSVSKEEKQELLADEPEWMKGLEPDE